MQDDTHRQREDMARLVDTYSGMLLGLCRLMLSDKDMAPDIVQETFLRAWKARGCPPDNPRAWLIRVAVNLCRDYHRSRWWRHIDRARAAEDIQVAAPEPEDQGILDMVEALPGGEREAIVLYFWENMPVDEIADTLRISRASVYRRLDRAKQRLKLELEGAWR